MGLAGAIPILLGDNIGTTITALLASAGQSKNAKRTAVAHSVFNITGSAVFIFLIIPLSKFVQYISPKGNEVDVIARQMAEDYKTYNPNAEITIHITDSTTGLTTAMRGECGFVMLSRELKEYEEELLTKKAIGKDAVAVIVNTENPIDDLSKKQLRELYDGNYKRWSDIE